MQIAITGHTGYIGGYLYNNLPAKKGFSRSQGYDITDPAIRQKIVQECRDMDVFINCAHGGPGTAQTDMLWEIYDSFKNTDRYIINIGTDKADPNIWSTVRDDYPLEKSILATTVDHMQKQHKGKCKISIINPNVVNDNTLVDIQNAVLYILNSRTNITSINLQ